MDQKHIELFKYLGIDPEFEELKDVKSKFESEFVNVNTLGDRKDLLAPHFAKTNGEKETAAKRTFKELGVEFAPEELKGKSFTEMLDIGKGKLNEVWTAKETELKSQVGQTDDKKYIALDEKFNLLKKDYSSLEAAKDGIVSEFGQYKIDSEKMAIEKDRTRATDSLWNTVKWAKTVPSFSRKGFKSDLEERFVFPFAEDGETLEVRDRKTNDKIANPNKAGSFFEPSELLQSEAVKEKLWELSPEQTGEAVKKGHNNQQQNNNNQQNQQQANQNGRPARYRHPAAG